MKGFTSIATSVTPTTTITTTENGPTATFLYPCMATVVDGCYVKKNAGARSHKTGLSAGMWAFIVLLMSSFASVLAADLETSSVLKYDNMTSAIDSITDMVGADPSATLYTIQVDDQIIGISNFTVEYPANITKRWDASNAPLGASWTQHQTAQQGTWWSTWYPASCVHQNGYGGEPVLVQLTQSTSYSATWSAGFSVNYGTEASLSIGYSTTETNTVSESETYTVPAYSYGQVWQQQLMVWQDQQHQHCHKYNYGKHGIKCGAWSAYVRGNLPVKNGQSFGWSTGYDKMDFSSCGGGT